MHNQSPDDDQSSTILIYNNIAQCRCVRIFPILINLKVIFLYLQTGAVVFLGRPRPRFAGRSSSFCNSSFSTALFRASAFRTRLLDEESWRSISSSSGFVVAALDLDLPTRWLFVGLDDLEVGGFAGLTLLLPDDVETLPRLTGSLSDSWEARLRLTGFLLGCFNGENFPS